MDDKKKQHECDCQDEHDEHCDCGCEEVDEDVIMLEDEDGNEIPFYYVATLERDGKEYVCLQSAEDDEDEGMVEIFELEEVEEGEEVYYNFLPIEDDIYDELFKQLSEEVASVADECDDPDCDCHKK